MNKATKEKEDLTTRNQLKGYGASSYQARTITADLTVVGKEHQSNLYKVQDVIASTRSYLQKKRIKPETRNSLQDMLDSLLARLGNLVQISFEKGSDPELSELAKQLYVAMSNTDKILAEMDAVVASIEGKRK